MLTHPRGNKRQCLFFSYSRSLRSIRSAKAWQIWQNDSSGTSDHPHSGGAVSRRLTGMRCQLSSLAMLCESLERHWLSLIKSYVTVELSEWRVLNVIDCRLCCAAVSAGTANVARTATLSDRPRERLDPGVRGVHSRWRMSMCRRERQQSKFVLPGETNLTLALIRRPTVPLL